MTRPTILAIVGVCAALGAISVGTVRLVRGARADLSAQLDAAQVRQVDELARLLREDIEHVGSDLRFVGGLVQGAPTAADRRDEIAALVTSVREYRLASVFDGQGTELLTVVDPALDGSVPPSTVDSEMRRTAREALAGPPGRVAQAHPFEVGASWFRVFALSLPERRPGRPAAVAVLVDTRELFAKIELITANAASHVILLGPRGRPTSATDPRLASAIETLDPNVTPEFAGLLGAMHARRHGLLRLDADEAERLGLGAATAVAAFAPVDVATQSQWAVATLMSAGTLDAHERSVAVTIGGAAAAVALLLTLFSAYLVQSQRRAAALRERLRASEQLSIAHARTQKIIDHIPTGVMTFTPDGRLTAVNHALDERVPRAAVGEPLAAAFPDAPEAVVRLVRSLLSSARASEQAQSLIGENAALFGEAGRYSLHAVPLDLRGTDPRILLVIEDVTHVHALESQLLRAEKLATIGELAAGMAHEVGTPLGVVRGRAEYVLRKLGPDHPQRQGIADIVEQIDAVTRTIRQLLDFSRISPAAVQPVDAAAVLRDVVELMRFEAERRKVRLELHAVADLRPIAANPDQLQQVLVNLTKNAIDASAAGGAVRLRAACDDGDGVAARVRIGVEDEGCGIPAADLNRIFDPFFTTKKRGQGTGLGLPIAAQVVRNHGAELRVESEEGRGTRFTLLWPTAEAEEQRTHG